MSNYTGDDFYCDVAIPNKIELKIEFENEHVLCYHHTRPYWPVHLVAVPKKHIPSFTVRNEGDDEIISELLKIVRDVARKVELEEGECRIITNLGDYQDSKHLHFHICSGDKIK